jgi:hypothetical protein
MSENKLGQDPAFPMSAELLDRHAVVNFNPEGMSKRFYAACAAMQGLLAGDFVYTNGVDANWTAKTAFNCADELLKQENE